MSFTTLPQPRATNRGSHITIVAARFNSSYVDALIEHCVDELERLDSACVIEIQRVPGSYEIPLATKAVVSADAKPDAVIAFGLLFDGETSHALLVAQSVTQALMDISLEAAVPVIHQVLMLGDEAQAHPRCFGEDFNRGTEAARAAISMIEDLRRVRRANESARSTAASTSPTRP